MIQLGLKLDRHSRKLKYGASSAECMSILFFELEHRLWLWEVWKTGCFMLVQFMIGCHTVIRTLPGEFAV